MNKMYRIVIIMTVISASAFADAVNIFGKITDTLTGATLDSVIVTLAKQHALIDTTSANGGFLLSGETSNILGEIFPTSQAAVHCSGPTIHFNVRQQMRVIIEAFSTSGKLLARPFDKIVIPGAYRLPVGLGFATQIICVRVTYGNDIYVFRMQGSKSPGKAYIKYDEGLKQAPLLKISIAATVDTLVFSRNRYVAKKIAVTSYSASDSFRIALRAMLIPRVMRRIPGGTFSTGIAGTADSVHSVTVSTFYIDTTEVTQADYRAVMGKNPAIHSNNFNKPVENVTWFDAVLFCNALSKRERFDTAYTFTNRRDSTTGNCVDLGGIAVAMKKKAYRLPTSAEWEYACRGGKSTTFYWGNDSIKDTVSKYAWYLGNVTQDSTTQPVATKKPNAYGLYDMSGNVWEWCTDQYTKYSSQAQTDPLVAPAGVLNLRGGDFVDPPLKISSGFHDGTNIPPGLSASGPAALHLPFFGFRVVIPPVYADTELSFMTTVGVSISTAKDVEVNAWYDTTHIPLLLNYAGLKQVFRYKKFSPADSLTPGGAGYWATYMFPTKSDIDGMRTSQEFIAAVTEMGTHWQAGECSTKVAVNYQKIKSWLKPDYTGSLNYVTVVRAEFKAGKEAEINNWYNNTHIPLIMKYPGVKKAARYQKIGASDDINATAMSTYLALYYYPTKADQDSMATSPAWIGPGGVMENMNNETIDNDMTTPKGLRFQLIKTEAK
jgi:formylglycine-generating enzyme required for sulfatase activity